MCDLYYYRARYYDPMQGRFISQDPIEFLAGDVNFYRYVGGDPVNFVDPSGLAGRCSKIRRRIKRFEKNTIKRLERKIAKAAIKAGAKGALAAATVEVPLFDLFTIWMAYDSIKELHSLQALLRQKLDAYEILQNSLKACEKVKKKNGAKVKKKEKSTLSNNKEAKQKAEELGYKDTGQTIKGQKIFKKGNRYITRDVDGHNGGAWKMADSPKNLGSKNSRMGTYDMNLNKIGD